MATVLEMIGPHVSDADRTALEANEAEVYAFAVNECTGMSDAEVRNLLMFNAARTLDKIGVDDGRLTEYDTGDVSWFRDGDLAGWFLVVPRA